MLCRLILCAILTGGFFSAQAQKLRPQKEGQPGISSTEGLPSEGDYRARKARSSRRKPELTSQDNYYSSRAYKSRRHRQEVIEDDKEKKPHPDYFGHRGKVHRRPSGRLRYCKVCGIRH
jgi:hypothetical protein